MYRCKDCGQEYKEKVDYCDCGNNTFDFVEDVKFETPKNKPKKALTLEQKSEIISRIFFAICLILSALVWAIPVKTKQITHEQKNLPKIVGSIPSIDKIWNDTPPVEKKEVKPQEVVVNETPIPLTPVPNYTKPKSTEQKKVTPAEPKKTEVKKTEPPKTSTIPKADTKNTPKVSQQTQKVEPKQTLVSKTETPPKPTYNPNSPEMLQYKGSLRAAMFSKFAVGSITGSGVCSVHFAVDSTGKLINRGFTKQSDNKSLNDAVYYMMMSVPKFSPPPSGYNGEMISMTFKINNGSYEISIY